MRAYEIVSDGGIDALALNSRPTPQPGPGEILVRMRASAINYRDQVKEKGVENLAQLYTEVKYTRPSHQEFSRRLLTYLENQDFMINE